MLSMGGKERGGQTLTITVFKGYNNTFFASQPAGLLFHHSFFFFFPPLGTCFSQFRQNHYFHTQLPWLLEEESDCIIHLHCSWKTSKLLTRPKAFDGIISIERGKDAAWSGGIWSHHTSCGWDSEACMVQGELLLLLISFWWELAVLFCFALCPRLHWCCGANWFYI